MENLFLSIKLIAIKSHRNVITSRNMQAFLFLTDYYSFLDLTHWHITAMAQ